MHQKLVYCAFYRDSSYDYLIPNLVQYKCNLNWKKYHLLEQATCLFLVWWSYLQLKLKIFNWKLKLQLPVVRTRNLSFPCLMEIRTTWASAVTPWGFKSKSPIDLIKKFKFFLTFCYKKEALKCVLRSNDQLFELNVWEIIYDDCAKLWIHLDFEPVNGFATDQHISHILNVSLMIIIIRNSRFANFVDLKFGLENYSTQRSDYLIFYENKYLRKAGLGLDNNCFIVKSNWLDQRFSTWGTQAACRGYAKF